MIARRVQITPVVLAIAVAYNAVVTQDVKLGAVPLKTYLLFVCLIVWALDRRPWRRSTVWQALTVPVLAVAVGVPAVWFVVALYYHHQHDPAQSAGLSYAVAEASRFLYLLLFFPLVDYLREGDRSVAQRIWLWPVLGTCTLTLGIWLAFELTGFDYAGHQFKLLTGTIGEGPGGFRVQLVTQVMVIPALTLVLAGVAGDRLRRGSAITIAVLLAATVVAHTRGFWLGLLAVAGILIVITNPLFRRARLRAGLLAAIVFALAASEVAVAIGPSPSSVKQISISQRLQQANELLHGTRRHLVLGSGLGATLPDGYTRSSPDPWSFELTYYQLLFEFGPVGLIVVLSLPLLACWRCWRARERLTGQRALQAQMAIAGMLALLIADSTNPYLITSVGMLAFAVCAANAELAIMAAAAGPPASPGPARHGPPGAPVLGRRAVVGAATSLAIVLAFVAVAVVANRGASKEQLLPHAPVVPVAQTPPAPTFAGARHVDAARLPPGVLGGQLASDAGAAGASRMWSFVPRLGRLDVTPLVLKRFRLVAEPSRDLGPLPPGAQSYAVARWAAPGHEAAFALAPRGDRVAITVLGLRGSRPALARRVTPPIPRSADANRYETIATTPGGGSTLIVLDRYRRRTVIQAYSGSSGFRARVLRSVLEIGFPPALWDVFVGPVNSTGPDVVFATRSPATRTRRMEIHVLPWPTGFRSFSEQAPVALAARRAHALHFLVTHVGRSPAVFGVNATARQVMLVSLAATQNGGSTVH